MKTQILLMLARFAIGFAYRSLSIDTKEFLNRLINPLPKDLRNQLADSLDAAANWDGLDQHSFDIDWFNNQADKKPTAKVLTK